MFAVSVSYFIADAPNHIAPSATDDTSIVRDARFLIGLTIISSKLSAIPFRKFSWFQFNASTPAVIEPPETLEILFIFGSQPISFNRQRTPV